MSAGIEVAANAARSAVATRRLRRIRRVGPAAGLILMYHEIAERSGNPQRDLSPALGFGLFQRQLRLLRRRYEVVALSQLCGSLQDWRPGRPLPVALTFDDDLSSHTRYAAPELARLGLPATFFIGGISLRSPRLHWWQELQTIYDRGVPAQERLRRTLASRWPWAARETDIRLLFSTIKALPPARLTAIAQVIHEEAGPQAHGHRLAAEDIRTLGASFDIGFHTLCHEDLQTLDDADLRRAMRDGRDELAAAVSQRLSSIAYPYCGADLRVAGAAADAGFELGVVCGSVAVRPQGYALLLDRIDAWSESLSSFELQLARAASS